MPHVPESPDAIAFDPLTGAELDLPAVARLPLRARAAFAVRCAKRVEPLTRLQPLITDAYASGVDIGPFTRFWRRTTADDLATDAARIDADKLRALNLGNPGEPGQPIRWNDPRLGPLWPNGEPEWYTEAVRAVRELDEQLRCLPDPNAPPDDPLMIAQMNEWREAERWDNEGKFKQYRGEYVFFGAGTIFGHGRSLVDLRPIAEAKAAAAGVPPERVVDYFVPGE